MNQKELLKYLQKSIPITRKMDLTVLDSSPERVAIQAGLKANRNHKRTAFGGSISTLMVLSCFSLMKNILEDRQLEGEVVIQRSQVEFLRPVEEDLVAVALAPDRDKLESFVDQLTQRGKGRLGMTALIPGVENLASFKGDFVVMQKK